MKFLKGFLLVGIFFLPSCISFRNRILRNEDFRGMVGNPVITCYYTPSINTLFYPNNHTVSHPTRILIAEGYFVRKIQDNIIELDAFGKNYETVVLTKRVACYMNQPSWENK